jgi:DNA-binding GntR family transcriptional regulator
LTDEVDGLGISPLAAEAFEAQFGLARNTLRKSLRKLEEQGKIIRHIGRGTFVAQPPNGSDSEQGILEEIRVPARLR